MTPAVDTVPAVERIMLSLPKELLEKLTELAKKKGLSRASFIRMVLTEHVSVLTEHVSVLTEHVSVLTEHVSEQDRKIE